MAITIFISTRRRRRNHTNIPIVTNINVIAIAANIRALPCMGAAAVERFRSGREVLDCACGMMECDRTNGEVEVGREAAEVVREIAEDEVVHEAAEIEMRS